MAKNLSIKPLIIVSIVLLLVAAIHLPQGYYVLLRHVVCLTASLLSWFSYVSNKHAWVWIMGFIALFFNPIIPLHFGREVWLVADVLVAVLFCIFLFQNKQRI